MELKTKRLKLRQWRKEDLSPFAVLNSDPEVMKYFPNVLSIEESNSLAKRFQSFISSRGWGFWALELIQSKTFIGFAGLNEPGYPLPVSPCIEIGWRLDKNYWGFGYATEAAKKCLEFAFEKLKADKIYSFTSVTNQRSRKVMERLNMVNTNKNFKHPLLPPDHPLCEHVLYCINKKTTLQATL